MRPPDDARRPADAGAPAGPAPASSAAHATGPGRLARAAGVLATAMLVLVLVLVAWLAFGPDRAAWMPSGERPAATPAPRPGHTADHSTASASLIARGAYLATVGHCHGCHTDRGGPSHAGGRRLSTPFGTVVASNLTPDDETGLGRWNADDFWRAMHEGVRPDGRALLPAFPYTHYTHVARDDSDAIHAYLRSLPPVHHAVAPHALDFPYGTRLAIAAWRWRHFDPAPVRARAPTGDGIDRGEYLVQGLGHCGACHGGRDRWGATLARGAGLGGGSIPVQRWYAPSLVRPDEASVHGWPLDDVVQLLRTGRSSRGSTLGPMAEVVHGSLQHLSDDDARAIARYLQALPQEPAQVVAAEPAPPAVLALGEQVYERHCAACHREGARGVPGLYPPLAGARGVLLDEPANTVRMILRGGFLPATPGNPRPFGMPPFAGTLNDAEVAAVATWLRQIGPTPARAVTVQEVSRLRGGLP